MTPVAASPPVPKSAPTPTSTTHVSEAPIPKRVDVVAASATIMAVRVTLLVPTLFADPKLADNSMPVTLWVLALVRILPLPRFRFRPRLRLRLPFRLPRRTPPRLSKSVSLS